MVAALKTANLGGAVSEGLGIVTMQMDSDIFGLMQFLALLPPHTVNIVQPHTGKLEPGKWILEFAPMPVSQLRNGMVLLFAIASMATAAAAAYFYPLLATKSL